NTRYKRAGRNLGVLRDQRVRRDQRSGANLRAIEDRCAHADEDVVADRAAMQDRVVAHRYPSSDQQWGVRVCMQYTAVLNIGAVTDGDRIHVTAKYCVVPNSDLLAECHSTDDRRV